MKKIMLFLVGCLCLAFNLIAQIERAQLPGYTLERISSFPLRFINKVEAKVNAAGKRQEKQTAKALRQVSRQEEKLYRKMRKADSLM